MLINIHNTIQTNSPKVRSEENLIKVPLADIAPTGLAGIIKKDKFPFLLSEKDKLFDNGLWDLGREC